MVIRSYRLGDRAEQQEEKYRDDGSHSFRGNRKEKKAGQRGRAKKRKCRVDARDWLEENRRREQENIHILDKRNTWSSSAFTGVGNTGRRGGKNGRTNNRGVKRQRNNVRWKNGKRMRVEEMEEDVEANDRKPDAQQSSSNDSARWRGSGTRPADRSSGRWKEARAGRGRSPEERMDRGRSPARCERRECCYSQEGWKKKKETGYGGSRDELGEERKRRRRPPDGGSPDYFVEKRMRRRSPEGWTEDRGSPDERAEDRMRRRSPERWTEDRGSSGEWAEDRMRRRSPEGWAEDRGSSDEEDRMRRRSPERWAEDGGSPDDWAGRMRGGGDRVQYDYRYPADDFDC